MLAYYNFILFATKAQGGDYYTQPWGIIQIEGQYKCIEIFLYSILYMPLVFENFILRLTECICNLVVESIDSIEINTISIQFDARRFASIWTQCVYISGRVLRPFSLCVRLVFLSCLVQP